MDGADVEHGQGSFDRPSHSAPFHAVLHQMSAGSFDHACDNRVTEEDTQVLMFADFKKEFPRAMVSTFAKDHDIASEYTEPCTLLPLHALRFRVGGVCVSLTSVPSYD